MNEMQFNKLIEKLEEIRCGIIDGESDTEIRPQQDYSMNLAVAKVRSSFFGMLDSDQLWNRIEIKKLFEYAVAGLI